MDLIDLKLFKQLYLHRNITEVSKQLYLSQPTLSYRLNKMQEELGCVLYEYDGSYRFTENGESFYAFCDATLSGYEKMAARFSSRNTVVINLSTVAAYRYTEKIYGLMKELDIYPVFNSTSSDTAIADLLDGRALAAVVGGSKLELPKSMVVVELAREKIVLVYNKELGERLEEIPIVLDEKESGLHKLVLEYLENLGGFQTAGEIGVGFDKIMLADQNPVGFFMPEYYLRLINPDLKRNVRVSGRYFFYRTILLLYNKSDGRNTLIKRLIDTLDRTQ